MKRSEFTFEKVFFVTVTALRLNRSHPIVPKNVFWGLQFLTILTLSVTSFGFLLNSALFYDIPTGKYEDASKNGTMALVALTITAKYLFTLYYQNYLKDLIETVNKDYEASEDFVQEEREIVVAYANRGAKVSKYWLLSVALNCIVFPLNAFLQMARYYWIGEFKFVPLFDMRYPDRLDVLKDIPYMYCLLFFLCALFDIFAGSVYVGFDPLAPIFLLHTCGQLKLLTRRTLTTYSETATSDEVNEKLKQINIKLQELYRLIDDLKIRFTILYECNMKSTTFLLPLSLFQVVINLRQQKFNLEFIMFFLATALQFYILSYYSNMLMDHSDELREAIYSCGWEKYPYPRVGKTILIMLTRTKTPMVLSTIFYPMCLDTFAEVCRQSYAIFNIMNAALAY